MLFVIIKTLLAGTLALVLLVAFLSFFGPAGLWVFLLLGVTLALAQGKNPKP
ncbi:MAG: hypothetical protein RLZZ352_212 [Pseudomonadota bacterium]|jgi:hypothetical protein